MDKQTLERELKIYSHWLLKSTVIDRHTTPHNILFREQHIVSLVHAMQNDPDYEYVLGQMQSFKDIENLADKMIAGLISGGASNTGSALKNTCKMLGIKTTYKAIREYLAE